MKTNEIINTKIEEFLKNQPDEENKEITLVCAYELDQNDKDLIYQVFPALKNCKIKTKIDKKLIAGMIIQIGSLNIDISFNAQLKDMFDSLYEKF